jgi:hypothetical protein
MVVTAEVTRLMTLSTKVASSTEYMLPSPSSARYLMLLNLALVPTALSTLPQEPAAPAKVLTVALATMILRMTQLPLSVT